MLQDKIWYCYREALQTELLQCRDEGKNIPKELEERVLAFAEKCPLPLEQEDYEKAMALVDELEALPAPQNPPFEEPSDLTSIQKLASPRRDKTPYDKNEIADKMHGAWLGRITGCLIGKPVEGRTREFIEKIAKADGNWPITRYLHGKVPNPQNDPFFHDPRFTNLCFYENINGCSPTDDDTNYTTFYLKLLEEYGRDFTSYDVVEGWLSNFPAIALCTAEMAGFRNFINHVLPPRSGSYRNPYREWIGAQIRGDVFGYVNPGDPFTAAEYAYRDACCTHTGNGIYGEMFASAMIAEAFVSTDMPHIIRTGLATIPTTSRLYRDIQKVLALYEGGASYEETVEAIHTQYPMGSHHNSVHTLANAMIVATALLYGENNYEKTMGMSVMPGMDTDCNGATVGSIIGAVVGAKNIPAHFTEPIGDTLCTDIVGNTRVRISEMAKRTLKLLEQTK